MARYVSAWSEPEVLTGRNVRALVVILRTSGCRWHRTSGGCLMCGYAAESAPVGGDDIADQFISALGRHEGEEIIKIYTSGSFLDPEEVPPGARDRILSAAFERAEHVLVESRPEFIPHLADVDAPSLEVAIGLESADDRIRDLCVRKGFSFEDFERAAALAHDLGASVRAYLLLKPPYLTEGEAIADCVTSMRAAALHSDTISINPVNVQRGTVVERLWRDGRYAPPWIWSLVEVLRTEVDARVISHPSGGGTPRGVHNCGGCDADLLRAVRDFSLDGDALHLDPDPACGCRDRWRAQRELEGLALTMGLDYRRGDRLGDIPLPETGVGARASGR